MHWNRKMRSLRRWTLRREVEFMINRAQSDQKEKVWLAKRLAETAGCPPDGNRTCGDCAERDRGDPCVRAYCWLLAAEDAVINEPGRSSYER